MKDNFSPITEDIKRVGFFGLGKTNLALMKHLPLEGREIILRSDKKIDRKKLPYGISFSKIYDGAEATSSIEEDLLIFSPSVRRDRPELLRAESGGVKFSSDAEMFFEGVGSPVFAVSGSDGKSTVATLTKLLLCAGGENIPLIGNIGEPMLPHLSVGVPVYVTELSSFSLMYLSPVTQRATITNITPNHLDWHNSFEEYKQTKLTLAEGAKEFVLNADDPLLFKHFKERRVFAAVSAELCFGELKNKVEADVYITKERGCICRCGEELLAISNIKRGEKHNIKNLMTAIAMCDGYVKTEEILSVAESFSGLEHRCERFFSVDGVDFINSSIDSTPDRTASTLSSLDREVVIILGGRGKGLPYEPLMPILQKYARVAVIFGENKKELARIAGSVTSTVVAESFSQAVTLAARAARPGEAVILSPASTSYDVFSNFEERGLLFKKTIKKLYCSE